MKVAEMMTREFETVHEEASLLEAMRHLQDCPLVEDEIGIKCVVVLGDDNRLAGVLTQSDVVGEILFPYFVRDLANRSDEERAQMAARRTIGTHDFRNLAVWADKVKVKDVMSKDPETIPPDADLFEVADRIVSRKVKSLPVLEDGKVVGIIYRSSMYRRIAAGILDTEPETEKSS